MFSGQRLRQRRQAMDLSQASLARVLGISRVSYFNWEVGKTQPNQKNLEILEQVMEVKPGYFDENYEILDIYSQLTTDNKHKTLNYSNNLLQLQLEADRPVIDLYEYRVYEKLSAGPGFSYMDDGNFDKVFYHEKLDHDFSSWIYGDSMEPLYLNGEVALIKATGFDYDGAIYAIDWDGQTYIKKVYREEDGLRLVSLNKKYSDKFAPYSENPRIIGKIVGHFKPTEV